MFLFIKKIILFFKFKKKEEVNDKKIEYDLDDHIAAYKAALKVLHEKAEKRRANNKNNLYLGE